MRSRNKPSSRNQPLSFLLANIRSVIPKRDALCSLIGSSSCDVLLLTETWLNTSVDNSEILPFLSHFDIFRKDRADYSRGGGVLIATNRNLHCSLVNLPSPLEMVWLRCTATHPHILIGVCYRPPNSDSSFTPLFHEGLNTLLNKYPNSPVLLFGDFNFPSIDWSDPASSLSNSSSASDFLNTCITFGLTQLVTDPTRITDHSSNVLDLVLTTHPDNFTPITLLRGLSDHLTVHASFYCNVLKKQKNRKTLTLYDKGDYVSINRELTEYFDTFSANFPLNSLESNWLLFKAEMHRLIRIYIPTITITEKMNSPWFNVSLKRLNNKKKRLFRAAKRANCASTWQNYYAVEKEYYKLTIETKHKFYSNTLPAMLQNNPKRFWKTINPSQCSEISLNNSFGLPIPENEIADSLNTVFSSVFTNEPPDSLPDLPFSAYPLMQNITFDSCGIVKVIESLNNSSSTAVDGINAKVLKNTKHVCSLFLSLIFQESLDSGSVPHDWQVGKVIPVFKKGSRASPSNYRPISITSVSCKVMEHIIYSHTANFLTSVNFFHPSQHGFRKHYSCDTQLALFLHDLHVNLDRNIPTDTIFLDFEKAFDKVPHGRLLLKLSRLNIHPCVLNWIRGFLTNRQQFVYANSRSSSLTPVLSGVPQGTVLGPLLFLIYINDLPCNISSHIRLFADDCVVYRAINNPSDHSILQCDLTRIQNWCNTWLMSLNVTKTVLMSIHRRQHHVVYNYSINNNQITTVDSFKYLGVYISRDLTWTCHINHIINSANRTLGYIRRNLSLAPPSIKKVAFETFVRPKLEYANAIFDPHHINLTYALESVQNRAARFILSNYSYTSSISALKAEINLSDLAKRRKIARLNLYHKFFHSLPLDNPYIRRAHRISRNSHCNAVYPPQAHTVTFQQSFFLRTAQDWNDLPTEVTTIIDTQAFKRLIETIPS